MKLECGPMPNVMVALVDIKSTAAEIRRGKKRKKKEEDRNHRAKI